MLSNTIEPDEDLLQTPLSRERTERGAERRSGVGRGAGGEGSPAFLWCRAFAARHQENFTVISWLLPRELRPHFASLYSYCRMTDDLGDEAVGDRLALLDDWEQDLRRCFQGEAERPVFIALAETVRTFGIPIDPFLRLIEANRIDQRVTRFETYGDLVDYCAYSAAPVGEMVLHVLGYHDAERQDLAASTCIALQLANFWQDITVDWQKGRVYLPLEDLQTYGVDEAIIARREPTRAFRDLVEFEVERARALFDEGRALEAMLDPRARLDVRLFRLGGEAVLDAIEAANYDVLTARPEISAYKKAWLALSNGLRIKLGR